MKRYTLHIYEKKLHKSHVVKLKKYRKVEERVNFAKHKVYVEMDRGERKKVIIVQLFYL